MTMYLGIKDDNGKFLREPSDNNGFPVKLSGSNVTLAASGDSGQVTGKAAQVGWSSTLRVNIWGTTFSVQIQAQMWDGTWYTLTGADFSTGAESTSFTTTGIFDFDVSGFQQVIANVVSGSANVKGALLP